MSEEAQAQQDLPLYVIEGARSGRSRCKSCRRAISKGALRLGVLIEGPYGKGYLWHHLSCAARHRFDSVEEAYGLEAWKEAKEPPEPVPRPSPPVPAQSVPQSPVGEPPVRKPPVQKPPVRKPSVPEPTAAARPTPARPDRLGTEDVDEPVETPVDESGVNPDDVMARIEADVEAARDLYREARSELREARRTARLHARDERRDRRHERRLRSEVVGGR